MIALLRRLFSIVAFVGVFAWLLTNAVDNELASGGVQAGYAIHAQAAAADAQSRHIVACGASSIGPSGRVTVTSCATKAHNSVPFRTATPGVLSEREASLAQGIAAAFPTGVATSPVTEMSRTASRSESTYQGKPIRWWAKRAVQARKDANARARTIRRLQTTARRQLVYPTGHWLDGAFLCIHRYERGAAGWATNTGNGYKGGLQFDSSFARSYGPSWAFRAFGGVERWPASVQIAAAVQAWTTRGFGPWPSTRRMCGL